MASAFQAIRNVLGRVVEEARWSVDRWRVAVEAIVKGETT